MNERFYLSGNEDLDDKGVKILRCEKFKNYFKLFLHLYKLQEMEFLKNYNQLRV